MVLLLFSSMSASSAGSSSWYPLCPSSHGKELEKPRFGNFSPFLPLWLWFPPLTVWGRRGDDTQFARSLKNPNNGESPCSCCPGLVCSPSKGRGLGPPPSSEITQQWELVLGLYLSIQSSSAAFSSSLDLPGPIACLMN